jgi:hypothetical protein
MNAEEEEERRKGRKGKEYTHTHTRIHTHTHLGGSHEAVCESTVRGRRERVGEVRRLREGEGGER